MHLSVWESCLDKLIIAFGEEVIVTWLRPLNPVFDDVNDTLTLYVPNKFVLDEVKREYFGAIEKTIKNLEPTYKVLMQLGEPKTLFNNPQAQNKKLPKKYSSNLNSGFIFDNFVEGNSNVIALSAARGVAKNPDGQFNPLMIYGSTGLGKSHLMHAIGNDILRNHPKKTIIYQTSEQFLIEMTDALSKKNIEEFKKYYRSIDILLIDDVQFIAGKEKTQEEFFHLFNDLHGKQKQIVLTCDKYPKDVDNLEERLKSRFGSGLSVSVEPPDLETRVAILKKKASLIDFVLPDNVAFFIAEKVKSHVRELEGALNKVFAMSQFTNQELTIDLAKVALKDILNSQSRQISIDNIQKTVANYYGLKVSDLKSKSRKSSLAKPRQIAMSIAKQLTTLSLPDIGASFERDHSTVIHAIKKVEEIKKDDVRVREDYANLITTLTS